MTENELCGACGRSFTDAEWEDRHTAHDDRCGEYLDQHAPLDAVCSCWPMDVHEACCEVCTPGGVLGAERAALRHLATRRLERAVEILDELPVESRRPATIAEIQDLLMGAGREGVRPPFLSVGLGHARAVGLNPDRPRSIMATVRGDEQQARTVS